jgi:hypothetical protein
LEAVEAEVVAVVVAVVAEVEVVVVAEAGKQFPSGGTSGLPRPFPSRYSSGSS